MKTDKTKLLQDIEAMGEKLASMEEELNKPEEFKHFPRKGDEYYYYTSIGALYCNTAADDELKVNTYKTEKEAQQAYNKAVAIEKAKRRILELQGDWKPDWSDNDEKKSYIKYKHYERMFAPIAWFNSQQDTVIPFMKNEQIANTIIKEMEDGLKLIFDIQ